MGFPSGIYEAVRNKDGNDFVDAEGFIIGNGSFEVFIPKEDAIELN